MSKEARFKKVLGELDPDVRVAILYVESLVNEKHRETLGAIPRTKPNDNSAVLMRIDSLQKQIDGLRPKVDSVYDLAKNYDEKEKYLKALAKKAEEILDEMKERFEELWKSGYYKKEARRKIRKEGLIK